VKSQEPIKVSRVSGRTVKRASFYDEVDEGEQHLRSSKSPQESQPTSHAAKAASSRSQDSIKMPEKSEPSRKKQKNDEKVAAQTKNTPSDAKSAKSQTKPSKLVKDKDEEMTDPPPIAPVRMKPVLQPPAPPIAAVRMKPVLQPPTPAIRPSASVPENNSPVVKPGRNTEDAQKPTVNVEKKPQGKDETNVIQTNTAPTTTRPEVSKKIEPPAPTSVPPKVDKPPATVARKVMAPKTATPRASPTLVQDISSNIGSTSGASIFSSFASTPLLDPVALEAAVKALPEPKIKAEKTGITKTPRRKPGARECMQISRRFGVDIIPEKYMTTLLDYCHRGKVEHLIKMRERLDCHSRFLEYQLAGLEARIKEVGESKIVVPPIPPHKRDSSSRNRGGGGSVSPVPLPSNKKAVLSGSTTKAIVANQASGKQPSLSSQAPGTTSLKINTESTVKKLPIKPVVAPKIPTSSSSITTTATKPALPAAPLANNTKAN